MTDKQCPRCGLWNSGNAIRCDCGYQFLSSQGAGSLEGAQPGQSAPYLVGESFWRRAGAYVIDNLAFLGTYYVLTFIVGILLGIFLAVLGINFNFNDQKLRNLGYISNLFVFMLYFVLFEGLYGATVGKMIMGMRVVKPDGKPCDLWAATVRFFLRFIDGLVFGIVAYSVMQQGASNQRLGDKAAKTVVVRLKDANIPNPRSWWWALLAALVYTSFVVLGSFVLFLLALE